MLISPRENFRPVRFQQGASVLAALVMVGILALTASAVQMTLPVSPSSQSAQAAAPEASVEDIANKPRQTPSSPTPASSSQVAIKKPVQPGFDVVAFLYNGSSGTQTEKYMPVCPPLPYRERNNADIQGINKVKTEFSKQSGSIGAFGDPQGRCTPAPVAQTDGTSRVVPIPAKPWPQWTLYCQSDSGIAPTGAPASGSRDPNIQNASFSTQDIATVADYNEIYEDVANRPGMTCKMLPPGSTVRAPIERKTGEQLSAIASQLAKESDPNKRLEILSDVNAADQKVLNESFIDVEKSVLLNEKEGALLERDALEREIKSIEERDDCKTNQGQGTCDKLDELNREKATLDKQIAEKDAQIKNLEASQKALDPKNNPNLDDPTKRQPAGQSGNSGQGQSGPAPRSGPQPGPNTFSGQNPGVASPLTGSTCTTGYICANNTLYYQAANSFGGFGGSASCMVQPLQQCQYGCQQPLGALTGAQQGGSNTTMGTIAQGLYLAGTVLKLFGGGSSGASGLSTITQSTSCATTPPQPQSPYGTGSNNQPCMQPPQQPSTSLCTSGEWKPTSAQNNGCTTGWQCVPTGTASTNPTTPTAQLSCEPKIIDVGMRVSFSFSCGNASGSKGTGFDTGGQIAGSTEITVASSSSNTANTYTLTCINQGITASSQCQVQVSKPGIIMVANPQRVKNGETTSIGWITAGMRSCVISSPDQSDFSLENANSTNANGTAVSGPITRATRFNLDCVTNGQDTRQASVVVDIN